MYAITERDVALLREYREVPARRHSLDLQRLLTRLRTEGLAGKVFVLTVRPGQEWALGQLGARRGDPVTFHDDRRFAAYAEASWALLRLRWERHAGRPWPVELDA